jgi:glycosyltransferase involved in cell wall biosynthesis
MRPAVCIAALNEASTINNIVSSLIEKGARVYLVDDGSCDNTGEIARAAGAVVISHNQPMGIAKSVMDTWEMALDKNEQVIVTMDAGGSHRVMDTLALGDYLIVTGADMVIGSRFCERGEYIGRKWRAECSRFAAFMMNMVSDIRFTDWTSGLRGYKSTALEMLIVQNYHQKMHAWQIEVLSKAIELGFEIAEWPITYTAGRSSLNLRAIDGAIMEWLWMMHKP